MFDKDYQRPQDAHHDTFGNIHTVYWFENAHTNLCNKDSDLYFPLIMFVISVGLNVIQRQLLEPVIFTVGIFNKNARNSDYFGMF